MRSNSWQLASTIIYVSLLLLVLKVAPSLKWIAFVTFFVPITIALINTISFFKTEKLFYHQSINLNFADGKAFLGKSSMFLVLQIASLICFQTDSLVIAHFLTFDEVAVFSVAAKLFSIPTLLLWVYLQILWPAYADALLRNDWKWIRKSYYRSILFSVLACILFVGGVFIFKNLLETYWLKNNVEIPYSLLAAYSCFVLVNVVDANMSSMLNGLNEIKIQVYVSIFMVLINLSLSIILVQHWGVSGVVWGSFIASLLIVLFFAFYLDKLINRKTGLLKKNANEPERLIENSDG